MRCDSEVYSHPAPEGFAFRNAMPLEMVCVGAPVLVPECRKNNREKGD